jgi:hypothetical protein
MQPPSGISHNIFTRPFSLSLWLAFLLKWSLILFTTYVVLSFTGSVDAKFMRKRDILIWGIGTISRQG